MRHFSTKILTLRCARPENQHFFCGIGIAVYIITMNDILLCSHNPILIKSLYGILIDEGCRVDIAEHPALAVQMVFRKRYKAAIIDPEPFGLSVDDAIKIIKTVLPDILVIFVGHDKPDTDALSIDAPIDLGEFKKAIHDVNRLQEIL